MASSLPSLPHSPSISSPYSQIPPGRLVEISTRIGGAAATSWAVTLLRQAQEEGETTAWIQPEHGPLYPPDLHRSGIDLDALIVVHVPLAQAPLGLCQAAEILLRSGGYGLVVVNLQDRIPPHPTSWQQRLLGLAREHQSRVLFLTNTPPSRESLGPLVALRFAPQRNRDVSGDFLITPHILKNKCAFSPEDLSSLYLGPPGLL